MNGGPMRHRVTVQLPPSSTDTAPDQYGQPITDPTQAQSWGPFWAHVQPTGSGEEKVGEQLKGVTTHKVTMRYVGSIVQITQAHQLLFKGRTLNVIGVEDVDERNRQLTLTCKEFVT
jgi:head-tail adaptor